MTDDKKNPTPRNPLPDEDKNPTRPQPGKMPDFSDTELDGELENETPDDAGNLDIYNDRGGDEAFDEEGGRARKRGGNEIIQSEVVDDNDLIS